MPTRRGSPTSPSRAGGLLSYGPNVPQMIQRAAAYVDKLFANVGATPTAAERNAAIAAYGSGDTAGRAAALRAVADSDSVFRRQYNPAFVLMQYYGYLRRDPDAEGYAYWLGKLNQFNGNYVEAEMVKAFISSIEYRQRFGQ